MTFSRRLLRGAKGPVTVVTALLVTLQLTGTAFGSTVHKKKGLSMPNVTIAFGSSSAGEEIMLAQQKGYFKAQGLNVTLLAVPTSTADVLTTLVAGSSQVINNNTNTVGPAVQQGEPFRSVALWQNKIYQELVINATVAAADGIPATGNTTAGAVAQFEALKNAHISVAITNTSGDGYNLMNAFGSRYGFTVGTTGNPNVLLQTVGSVAATSTAFQSGKDQGLIGNPPATVQSNAITIQLFRIPPIDQTPALGLETTVSMIQQHSDTVQAVVTGAIEGWNFEKTHLSTATKILGPLLNQYEGITSPEVLEYSLAGLSQIWGPTPVFTKVQFQNIVTYHDDAVPSAPFTFTFSQYVDNKFAIQAIKALGYKYSTKQ